MDKTPLDRENVSADRSICDRFEKGGRAISLAHYKPVPREKLRKFIWSAITLPDIDLVDLILILFLLIFSLLYNSRKGIA